MARYVLNIAVGFLAFALGSFIAIQFDPTAAGKTLPQNAAVVRPEKPAAELNPASYFPFSEAVEKQSDRPSVPTCLDKKILPVWNLLQRDSEFKDRFAGSRGSSADCSDMLEASFIDLNKDGEKEILLRGANFQLCSAVGNCGFWVFRKAGQSYKKILVWSDYIDITEMGDQVEKASTNGYSGLLLKGHMDASNTHYFYFRYDGQKYRQTKCMVDAYVPGSNVDGNAKWKFVTCREYERNYSGR
jgi:hypothetical protein